MCLLIDMCVERERDENFIYISKQQQIHKGRMRLKLALVSIIFLLPKISLVNMLCVYNGEI